MPEGHWKVHGAGGGAKIEQGNIRLKTPVHQIDLDDMEKRIDKHIARMMLLSGCIGMCTGFILFVIIGLII